jgi:branched-chain amino acid transport system permease protein
MESLVENIVNAISLGSFYALVALGIALIFGIMRLVNIAHGEFIMAGGYVLVLVGASVPVLILFCLLVSALLALVAERLVFRPMRKANAATLLVGSFALSYLLQNLAILIFGANARAGSLGEGLTEAIAIGDVRIARINVITLAVTILLGGLLMLFLKRTRLGVQMRAAAEDFETARLMGVRANRVIAASFVLSGLLAGTVAVLLVGQTGAVSPTIGLPPLLIGLVAVVIGGLGSLPGAVLGAYILGAASVALQAGLPVDARPFRDAFLFALVIVILTLRPQGIVARKVRV